MAITAWRSSRRQSKKGISSARSCSNFLRLERVHKRAIKLIPELSKYSNIDRLKALNLPALKYRWYQCDKDTYDHACVHYDFIGISEDSIRTRGNRYKLLQNYCYYDLRKLKFTNRVIPIWNSLPDYVVCAETVNTFKNKLDKYWSDQKVLYDYNTDLHGIGNRSIML